MTNARRKLAIVGVVGLAAVMGSGAYVLTDHLAGDKHAATSETGALAPAVTRSSAAPESPATETSALPRPKAKKSAAAPSTSQPTTPATRSAEERIKAAREAARKDGHPIRRPLPRATVASVADVKVTNTGSLKADRGTMRVVSGHGDLTGYRELGWVSGTGEAVGNARCSQTFRFAQEEKPSRKPNLLVCWRTSAAKSVYTVTVNIDGKPSKQKSVAAIEAEWARLG